VSSGCSIVRRRPAACTTAPRNCACRRSPRCGACGSPALRSPSCSACRWRRCPGSWRGSGSAGSAGWGSSRRVATSANARASCSTSTSRSSGASSFRDTRVTGNRRQGGRRTTYTPDGRRIGDAGWEYVHVCVDDATRLAYAEVLQDEKATTTVAFLRRAVAFYRRHGIAVEAVLTDNGPGYRSALHSLCCRLLGLKHLRTRPRRPQTNGKAERFIRTMLGEWAYGAIYGSSSERTAALPGFLWRYNFKRNHGALGRKPPAARLAELNNALGSYN
jgi:transposase InsO family protein